MSREYWAIADVNMNYESNYLAQAKRRFFHVPNPTVATWQLTFVCN